MSTFCQCPFLTQDHVYVPCGHCPNCWRRRISAWSFRLRQELKVSTTSYFITLTYDERHLPMGKLGYPTLDVRDTQLFFKRFRKQMARISSVPVRYFLVGEYGSKLGRPHYHVLLFNGHTDFLGSSWERGNIQGGTVTGGSIGYCLKYMCKPGSGHYTRFKRGQKREFATMSKGIGVNYLSPRMIEWHKNDLMNRMYCPDEDGKKVCMPRYYKKIYTDEEREAIAISQVEKARELNIESFIEDYEKHGDEVYDWRTSNLVHQFEITFNKNRRL